MKNALWLSLGILALVIGCRADRSEDVARLEQEVATLKALVGPPPRSLDALYPPQSQGPVFLAGMFGMATPFTGIVIDLQRGNMEQARAHFEGFKARYAEVAKMVPEWEKDYPLEPLEDLGASLKAGEHERAMVALGTVAQVCHNCHVVNMPRVQHQYHWDDFSGLGMTDPVTQEDVAVDQFMVRLETAFQGIGVDLERGRVDQALAHFEAFDRRFQALKETCEACHETERRYYVDTNIQGLVDSLGTTLRSTSPDPRLVGALRQEIGTESCLKCHWVHIPASYTRAGWKALDPIAVE